jgi:hypothetical protein
MNFSDFFAHYGIITRHRQLTSSTISATRSAIEEAALSEHMAVAGNFSENSFEFGVFNLNKGKLHSVRMNHYLLNIIFCSHFNRWAHPCNLSNVPGNTRDNIGKGFG